MKRSIQYRILIAEALILIGLAIIPAASFGAFTGIMAFPFEQIGLALRMLSLSGATGNAAAIALYIVICLLPLLLVIRRKNPKFYLEDALVPLLSLALFAVIYQMINPGSISYFGGFADGTPIAKAILGGTAYSILSGYVILRVLRLFYVGVFNEIQRYIYILLFILNMLFVAVISYGGVNEIIQSVNEMHISNSANRHLFAINYLFIGLGFIVAYIPYVLNIIIIFSAMSLLQSLHINRYSEETIASAVKLSNICRSSL